VASDIRPYKLVVDRVFYVGGLGSDKRAEVVAAADYAASKPDMLCKHANAIVVRRCRLTPGRTRVDP